MKKVLFVLSIALIILIFTVNGEETHMTGIIDIKITGVDFKYSPLLTEHFAVADNKTESVRINAELKEGYSLKVNNKDCDKESEDIPLKLGYNLVLLSVKDSEGNSKNVRIVIKRMQDESILYKERYRPQFHNSTQINLMNDPNGLVYNEYTKEYHLFYQQDAAFEKGKESKCWAHSVSADLVNWKDAGIAIIPDDLGEIYSGSCVIDKNNTSGLFPESVPAGGRMVALYTFYSGHEGDSEYGIEKQGLSYSLDQGVTWIKYSGNPVIKNGENFKQKYTTGFRDPKVFWYEEGNVWMMVVAGAQVRIFTSPDLINWTYNNMATYSNGRSPIESECPDLFPMEVNGDANNIKWVFCGSDYNNGDSKIFYVVGNIVKDDKGLYKFVAETKKSDSINANNEVYAAQTFYNVGRRISISWIRDWVGFNEEGNIKNWLGTHTLPVTLKLVTDNEGYRLKYEPAEEIKKLRSDSLYTVKEKEISDKDDNLLKDVKGELYEIDAVFELGTADKFGFKLRCGKGEETSIIYDVSTNKIVLDRQKSGNVVSGSKTYTMSASPIDGKYIKMRILVDTSIVDLYVNDGESMCNTQIYPDYSSTDMELFVSEGSVKVNSLDIYKVKSIWDNWQEKYVPGELGDDIDTTQKPVSIPRNNNVFKYIAFILGFLVLITAGIFIGIVIGNKKKEE